MSEKSTMHIRVAPLTVRVTDIKMGSTPRFIFSEHNEKEADVTEKTWAAFVLGVMYKAHTAAAVVSTEERLTVYSREDVERWADGA